MSDKAPISVLIATYNEEIHIRQCLESVAGWADEIFVVDSFSTDRTVDIAKGLGAHVAQHEFKYPAQQKNWALKNLPIRNEWVLLLDADERVPDGLRDEINRIVRGKPKHEGYWMRYRLMFYGKWIRYCGWYPTWILRLVRRSKVKFEDREVDEHAVVDGTTGRLTNDLIHENLRDMTEWIAKHNRYASQNATIYAGLLAARQTGGLRPQLFGEQAERKRFVKERIWLRLPARGLLFFFYLYVLRLGFLDGGHGLRFCVMRGIFEHFNNVKLWELQNYKQGAAEGAIQVLQRAAAGKK